MVVGSEPPLPMLEIGPAMKSILDAMEPYVCHRPTSVLKEKTNVCGFLNSKNDNVWLKMWGVFLTFFFQGFFCSENPGIFYLG